MSDNSTLDKELALWPLNVYRFRVEFRIDDLFAAPAAPPGSEVKLCSGAFSECTGLDATMEPKVIKEGGLNYGAHQRVGPVTFGTVVLKRGMTRTRDLWKWFSLVGNGGYSYRLRVDIVMQETSAKVDRADYKKPLTNEQTSDVLKVRLYRALPVKFRSADLNASGGSTIAIEELHLAHEGMTMEMVANG
jgi:phage tail-like protein